MFVKRRGTARSYASSVRVPPERNLAGGVRSALHGRRQASGPDAARAPGRLAARHLEPGQETATPQSAPRALIDQLGQLGQLDPVAATLTNVVQRATQPTLVKNALAAVPTAASGLSDWSDTYGPDQRVGLVPRSRQHRRPHAADRVLSCSAPGKPRARAALSMADLGAATAGYLGGHLVYASGVGVNHAAFEHRSTDWTDVGDADALAESTPLRVDAHAVPVVVVKSADRLYALSATCVHAGGPARRGRDRRRLPEVPLHASMFRLEDCRAVRGPSSVDQPVWQARIHDGRVQVLAEN